MSNGLKFEEKKGGLKLTLSPDIPFLSEEAVKQLELSSTLSKQTASLETKGSDEKTKRALELIKKQRDAGISFSDAELARAAKTFLPDLVLIVKSDEELLSAMKFLSLNKKAFEAACAVSEAAAKAYSQSLDLLNALNLDAQIFSLQQKQLELSVFGERKKRGLSPGLLSFGSFVDFYNNFLKQLACESNAAFESKAQEVAKLARDKDASGLLALQEKLPAYKPLAMDAFLAAQASRIQNAVEKQSAQVLYLLYSMFYSREEAKEYARLAEEEKTREEIKKNDLFASNAQAGFVGEYFKLLGHYAAITVFMNSDFHVSPSEEGKPFQAGARIGKGQAPVRYAQLDVQKVEEYFKLVHSKGVRSLQEAGFA